MAVYRQVQTAYWQDEFVLQLTPEERYFYIYLLTNSKTKQCGIYQLPIQVIIMETGYNQETSEKLLKRFVEYGKIICNSKTKEIGIINWPRYNPMESPKIRACVEKELKEVKDKSMIEQIYPDRYPMQGVSQEEKEEEKEKAEEEAEEREQLKIGDGDKKGLSSTAATAGNLFEEGKATLPYSRRDSSEENDDYGDYQCTSIQMQAELLIIRLWNRQRPSPEEVRIAADYIKKFTYSEVEIAFIEAVKYDRKKLAYVETVCKKRKERADFAKKKEQERQKRLEQDRKLEEQRKSGKGLGLIAQVFGEEGVRSME